MSRIRLPESEKARLVREWDRSGRTAAEFAAPHDLSAETLRRWGRDLRGPRSGRSSLAAVQPSDVVEVLVGARDLEHEDAGELCAEIVLRNGRRLNLFGALSLARLAEIAAALEGT